MSSGSSRTQVAEAGPQQHGHEPLPAHPDGVRLGHTGALRDPLRCEHPHRERGQGVGDVAVARYHAWEDFRMAVPRKRCGEHPLQDQQPCMDHLRSAPLGGPQRRCGPYPHKGPDRRDQTQRRPRHPAGALGRNTEVSPLLVRDGLGRDRGRGRPTMHCTPRCRERQPPAPDTVLGHQADSVTRRSPTSGASPGGRWTCIGYAAQAQRVDDGPRVRGRSPSDGLDPLGAAR